LVLGPEQIRQEAWHSARPRNLAACNRGAPCIGCKVARELSFGQYLGNLRVRQARPMPHAARIEMYESGARVEPDATALGAQPGRTHFIERHAGNEEVDRLALHVLAMLGDPAR